MKRYIASLFAASCLASPALAIEVTNLDKVEHHVLYEAAGSREVISIQPSETERLPGVPSGRISLLDIKTGKKKSGKSADSSVQADGILSGVIGAARTVNIPSEGDDTFVIWEDGTFAKQQSRRNSRATGT